MRNIIVTTPSFCKYIKEPVLRLKENGFEIINDYGLKEYKNYSEEKRNSIEAIIVGLEKIDNKVLDLLPDTKAVLKHGAGIDNIDLKITQERNIKVFNVPGANSIAVADTALALMLNVSRMICLSDKSVREGKWERFYGVELHGKTLSIIGFGAIGKEVARRAKGFGMNVLAYDVIKTDFEGVEFVGLNEAVSRGDYISLHTPINESTYHMIDGDKISKMKETAFIINTARGGIIDEDALIEALESKRIAGAAIDAYENEPEVNPRFFKLDNVLLTSHLGGFTKEATNRISIACTEFILTELKK